MNWKLRFGWFVAAIAFVVLYFIFTIKQDYAATTVAHLAGLQPSMKYHFMAVLSLCAGLVCYWWWMMAHFPKAGVEKMTMIR